MTNTHHDVALLGGRGNNEVLGELVGLSAEGVVADRLDSLRNVLEATSVIMTHSGDLSMHNLSGVTIVNPVRNTSGKLRGNEKQTYAISPPRTSAGHSEPMQTPKIGTLPMKYVMAACEIPASVCGCPGPGEITNDLICKSEKSCGEMASFRMTMTSVPRRHRDW